MPLTLALIVVTLVIHSRRRGGLFWIARVVGRRVWITDRLLSDNMCVGPGEVWATAVVRPFSSARSRAKESLSATAESRFESQLNAALRAPFYKA